jgi:hypothetical protein
MRPFAIVPEFAPCDVQLKGGLLPDERSMQEAYEHIIQYKVVRAKLLTKIIGNSFDL